MLGSQIQDPTRAVIVATAAGAVVATATMILPADLLFVSDGPFQAEVRAFIAFGSGALTLMGAMGISLGRSTHNQNLFQKFGEPIEDFAQSTARTRSHLAIKMPWHQSADERSTPPISERLRSDFVDANDSPVTLPDEVPNVTQHDEIPADFDEPTASEAPLPSRQRSAEPHAGSSIADMIDQFESAVAQRHQKLAELSASIFDNMPEATDLASESNAKDGAQSIAGDSRRPTLELVSSSPVTDDDADSALAAALATLERITVRAR